MPLTALTKTVAESPTPQDSHISADLTVPMKLKKATYAASTKDVKVIYDGSKNFWRQRTSIDIYIVSHTVFHIIEVICFDHAAAFAAPRIYISKETLKPKLDSKDIEEKIRLRKEFFLRQKKPIVLEEILEEVLEDEIVHYITSKINLKETVNQFEVVISHQTHDALNPTVFAEVDLCCEKPVDLHPFDINYKKSTTYADFNSKLTQFREESNAVKKYNDNALHALYSDTAAFVHDLQEELEVEKKISPVKLRWLRAIKKVMARNTVKKMKARLAMMDKLQRMKLSGGFDITRGSRQQRKTLDNSFLEKLPPVNPKALPLSPHQQHLPHLSPRPYGSGGESINHILSPHQQHLLHLSPRPDSHHGLSPHHHLPPMQEALLEADAEDSESSKVFSAWTAAHNHVLPRVTGQLPSSSVASKTHRLDRKSFEPPSSPSLLHNTTSSSSNYHAASIAHTNHAEDLLVAAARPAPSLAASYREASLHAMGLEKALSIPHLDISTVEISHPVTATVEGKHHGVVHPHGAIAPNSILYVSHSMNRI
mmetsp:Transcript_4027/g.5636  ORF Transcript_4027/g.5636 Transcript_4027/m.5636 type:complete len:539 (+) Transcript_4027:439-2055(+)